MKDNKQVLISIIVPMYNAGNQLERLLLSIQNQKFTDYEVLLMDDGSNDNTKRICENWEKLDSRFHYYYHENVGVSQTRNRGMKKTKGEYITFLDADDEIDSNYLEELLGVCGDSDIAICDVVCESEDCEAIQTFSLPEQKLTKTDALNYILRRTGINSGPYAKLFRKRIVENLSFPAMRAYEDIIFVVQAFANTNKISVSNKTSYHYICNQAGAMQKFIKNPSLDIIVATEWLVKFYKENSALNDECLYVTLSHLYQYVIPLLECEESDCEFVEKSRNIFRKYYSDILFNKAFPWKEKIVYGLFALGWSYKDKKLSRIRG